MGDLGGYDAHFVVPPPNELTCPVCTCVVRDPIQIAGCGHRLCSVCYDSLKKFTGNCTCPTDRTVIKDDKVFKDVGADRTVLSLEVKCDYFTKGCMWVGELRDLQKHIGDCFYQKIDDLVKLQDKFEKLESSLEEKDAEIRGLRCLLENLMNKRKSEEMELCEVKKDLGSNASKLQSLSARIDDEIKKLESYVANMNANNQKSERLELDKLKSDFDSSASKLQSISDRFVQKMKKLDEEVENIFRYENAKDLITFINQKSNGSTDLLHILEEKKDNKEIDALEEKVENLTKKLHSSLKTVSKSVEGKFSSIGRKSNDLRSQLLISKEQISELSGKVENLTEQLWIANFDYQKLYQKMSEDIQFFKEVLFLLFVASVIYIGYMLYG